ncbi:hypothetical protein [Streptomyces olivoreticuli]|uniref:hypothetical protein n=1 Tax=Streptomyces olivoreticuli TaxID=68246 RepID=UPI000E257D84|nr:hypothetical protein [Streptomyces olivoreticuli]
MPATTVLRIAVDGTLTELDITGYPGQQAKILARSLLDAPEVITYIHHPKGCLAVIGGKNRARSLPNFHAGIALEDLSTEFHDVMGAVVFTGYRHYGDLTELPDDAAAHIRGICPRSTN